MKKGDIVYTEKGGKGKIVDVRKPQAGTYFEATGVKRVFDIKFDDGKKH